MSFVDALDFPVGLVLRVLDIASSTYYQCGPGGPRRVGAGVRTANCWR